MTDGDHKHFIAAAVHASNNLWRAIESANSGDYHTAKWSIREARLCCEQAERFLRDAEE